MRAPAKPVQAYCRRCEKLFCYFVTNCPRVQCGLCKELERADLLAFHRDQSRKKAAARRQPSKTFRRFLNFKAEITINA